MISSTWSSWNKLGAKVKPRACDLSAWRRLLCAIHSSTLWVVTSSLFSSHRDESCARARNVSHTRRPIWINHILFTVSFDINVTAVCRPTERIGQNRRKNRLKCLDLVRRFPFKKSDYNILSIWITWLSRLLIQVNNTLATLEHFQSI